MRFVLVITLVTAAFTAPQLAAADPALPQTLQSSTAAPATATATPAPNAPPATAVAAVQPSGTLDEIVCKTSPPKTGTRLGGSRECHTVREWNEREKQAQDMLARTQSQGMQQPVRSLPGTGKN
jgi:cytochrome c5